jgi:signal transduction histidine kinase
MGEHAPRGRGKAARLVRVLVSIGCLTACLRSFVCVAAEPLPRSAIIINQFSPGPFDTAIISAIRPVLNRDSAAPVSVYTEALDLFRFNGEDYERLLRTTFAEKYREKPIGVVVALGIESLRVVLRWRTTLWPDAPVVFTYVNEDALKQLVLPPDVTGRTFRANLRNSVAVARALVPDLKRIAVIGDPAVLLTSRDISMREALFSSGEIALTDLTGLSMAEIKTRAASLPPDAAILYTSLFIDGTGVRYIPRDALVEIASVANRPIVVLVETQIGAGGAGGFVSLPDELGREAGKIALRILNGERASNIPIAPGATVKPVFDGRELKRWNVSDTHMPPGSEVRFRELSGWEQYRTQIIAIVVAMLLQTAVIMLLLYENRRRRAAEAQARSSVTQLAHMERVATAGELSASIAHEVNQPLAAIVAQASAGLRWLANTKPNVDEARAAFKHIIEAGHHAAGIIDHVRAFFKKSVPENVPVDVNDFIREVFQLVGRSLKDRRVAIETDLEERLPLVLGDRVQLQQVVMNLVMNAAEAMEQVTNRPRLVRVISERYGALDVMLRVEDSGPGIAPSQTERIFKPFFTTKANGMGIGLSISRSIVNAHHGKLWASRRIPFGTVFHLVLPAAGAQAQEAKISPQPAALEDTPAGAA